MQLQGSREMNGENGQGSDLAGTSGMEVAASISQAGGNNMSMTWPLNIFDIGHGES
jgi:hypothetical protein